MKNIIYEFSRNNLLIRNIYFYLKSFFKRFKTYFNLLKSLLREKNFYAFILCLLFFYIFLLYTKKIQKNKHSTIHYTLT